MRAQAPFSHTKIVGQATVRAPGTCGELVQGFRGGAHFLVTCPVDLYSRVSVRFYQKRKGVIGPEDCPKSIQGVQATLAYLRREDLGAELTIESSLPRGKGMASSTADVAGAITATALALGRTLAPAEVARLAISLEPSDGIMFPGLALLDHRTGSCYETLGLPPPMEIVVLDFGGTVDTLEFNRVDRTRILSAMESELREALAQVRQGLALGEPELIGKGATASALTHQRVLYKPQLQAVIDFAKAVGAAGVNVAHSGTVLGVLLDGRLARGGKVLAEARRAFPELEASLCLRLIGGGIAREGV